MPEFFRRRQVKQSEQHNSQETHSEVGVLDTYKVLSEEFRFSNVFPEVKLPVIEEEKIMFLQTLVDSVGWTVLRFSSEKYQGEPIPKGEKVTAIETSDKFASKWMDRDEIVTSIKNRSGLPESLSERGLKAIEDNLDSQLKEKEAVKVPAIGTFRSNGTGGYKIDLDDSLHLIGGRMDRE